MRQRDYAGCAGWAGLSDVEVAADVTLPTTRPTPPRGSRSVSASSRRVEQSRLLERPRFRQAGFHAGQRCRGEEIRQIPEAILASEREGATSKPAHVSQPRTTVVNSAWGSRWIETSKKVGARRMVRAPKRTRLLHPRAPPQTGASAADYLGAAVDAFHRARSTCAACPGRLLRAPGPKLRTGSLRTDP